jgi:hypothetical protein
MTRHKYPSIRPYTLADIRPSDLSSCASCQGVIVWVPDARCWVHWWWAGHRAAADTATVRNITVTGGR